MVDHIDIHKLTLEELSGVVDIYPWYSGARMELCRRMGKLGILSENQLAQSALYISSRRLVAGMLSCGQSKDYSDKDARQLVRSYISSPAPQKKQVYVVGGDYFTQEDYNSAKHSDDGVFSSFVHSDKEYRFEDNSSEGIEAFYTETLAKIYLEQDYKDEAIEIYSKLSLRYPEKSVYFAALIDEIKQK